MFNITKKELNWGGKPLVLETGRIARQADGAVLASVGGTYVLCTVVGAKKPKEGVDFFPLTVNYQEKAFAAGKIPGGFFKREGRPSEKETLTSRLIDRPIRPLFDEQFRNETQVVATVLSYDAVNEPDIVALVGCAAALAISGVPFNGPIAAARVGYANGEYILNPSLEELKTSELDLVVAGTKTSVLMVESEAKELDEEVMLGAVMFGHKEFQPVIKLIEELVSAAGKPRWKVEYPDTSAIEAKVKELGEAGYRAAFKERQKQVRSEKIGTTTESIKKAVMEANPETDKVLLSDAIFKLQSDIVRKDILENRIRIDGRDEKTVRPIICETGVLPRTHGSGLFTRGETQALAVTTLGGGDDEQILDALEGEGKQHFMLHYNFPPYSVGEATPMRPPGRREIGHGKLAWRALHPIMPTKEEFPYTVRIVSEVTESNGSSSMATVCSSSMALMDAGCPLPRSVAGIAMGLIKEGDKFSVLSDIMGDEDHLGDMDFKVAGTEKGITALQMDIKINGITEEIMQVALKQANAGRQHILGEMAKAITGPRESINENAPRMISFMINKEKIREVIGSGGKVIREICEKSGAKVDIDDSGKIVVMGANTSVCELAKGLIMDIAAEPEIGKIYDGTVVRIVDFGAFVNFMGAKDGLVHISEITETRLNRVTDALDEGDKVQVKVIGVDEKSGKVKLSIKAIAPLPLKPGAGANNDNGDEGGRDRYNDRNEKRGERGDRNRRGGGRDRDRGDRNRDRGRDRGERRSRDFDDDNRGNRAEETGPGITVPESSPVKKKKRFWE